MTIYTDYDVMELIEPAYPEDQVYELSSEELIISIPKWHIEPEPVALESR